MTDYVFEGNVIRLTARDYNELWQNYLPDLTESQWLWELTKLDDYMEGKTGNKKSWYFTFTAILRKKMRDRSYTA